MLEICGGHGTKVTPGYAFGSKKRMKRK